MILIVPDVHEEIDKLEHVLVKYKDVERVVFLGDFMDTFAGLTWATNATVQWIKKNVSNPKYKFIWGNHDMHYAFPVGGTICSGWDKNKLQVVKFHLTDEEHWKKFDLLTWLGQAPTEENPIAKQWLISHAGLHPYFLHPIKGFDLDYLDEMAKQAMWTLRYEGRVLPFIAAGKGRGGDARVGGIDWLDWESEFIPILNLNQIVGHSCGKKVRMKHIENINLNYDTHNYNYCIDTALRNVVLMEDDGSVVTIENV